MATEYWTAWQHEPKINSLSVRLFSGRADARIKNEQAIIFWPVRLLILIWDARGETKFRDRIS